MFLSSVVTELQLLLYQAKGRTAKRISREAAAVWCRPRRHSWRRRRRGVIVAGGPSRVLPSCDASRMLAAVMLMGRA